jgi:hypothetical protein
LVGLVVVSLVIVGLALGNHAVSHSAPPRPAARSPLAVEIDQFAVDFAADAGNTDPGSVTWGACPAGGDAANPGLCQPGSPLTYVLAITGGAGGDFYIYAAGAQFGGTPPHAPFVVTFFSPSTWDVGDLSLSPTPVDLSSLGSVETDSLAGIPPISTSAFQAKYHIKS